MPDELVKTENTSDAVTDSSTSTKEAIASKKSISTDEGISADKSILTDKGVSEGKDISTNNDMSMDDSLSADDGRCAEERRLSDGESIDKSEYDLNSQEQIDRSIDTKRTGEQILADAKKYRNEVLSFMKRFSVYETNRLEYEKSFERYQYSIDPDATDKNAREMKHRIFWYKLSAMKALRFEKNDRSRYAKALSLDYAKCSANRDISEDELEESKAKLALLLDERAEIERELFNLYEEKYKDFVGNFKVRQYLKARLYAAKKAYRRYKDIDTSVSKYIFPTNEKIKLYDCVNKCICLSAELSALKHRCRFARISEQERAELKREMADIKHQRAAAEHSVSALVAKARTRTYLYGENGLIRWLLRIGIVIGLLVAMFCIFYDPIMSLIN